MNFELGLGSVTFGREVDRKDSFALMDFATDHEIFHFDTAAVYGSGTAEEIIGSWLSSNLSKKDQVKLATKIIPPFGYQKIISAVEQSLSRLGVDVIDLLYFHRWDESLEDPESWLALSDLIDQGKIRNFGVSNFNTSQLRNALALLKANHFPVLSAIQNNHNLAVSDFDEEMQKLCEQNEIQIVTFSPLGAGFLTGKHQNGVAKGSRFDLMPAHQQIYFNDFAHHRLEKLLSTAKKTGYDPAYLALAWAMHQPFVNEVLIGGRNIGQLNLALKAKAFSDQEILHLLTQ